MATRRQFSVLVAHRLLCLGALLVFQSPSKADSVDTSVGVNGVLYQVQYDFFVAPDPLSTIDSRLTASSWWGNEQAAGGVVTLLQTPLGAAYAVAIGIPKNVYRRCYYSGISGASLCSSTNSDDLILNYQAIPTSANPNVSGAATSILSNSPGPQQPLATGLGPGVGGFVVTGLAGQPTISGATSNADFNGVLAAVNALGTQAEVNRSYEQVIAEPYASYVSVGLETLERFRQDALELALSSDKISLGAAKADCQPSGTVDSSSKQPAPLDAKSISSGCKEGSVNRWSLFLDASNTEASLNGTESLASLDYRIFQSTYGLEYQLSDRWRFGGVFGYGQNNLSNYEFSNVSIEADTYSGGVYGVYAPSPSWKIAALAGYTNFQNDSSRPIQFGTIDRTAQAQWSGNGLTVALITEYDWVLAPAGPSAVSVPSRDSIRIKPRALVSYASYSQDAINESGADSLDLAVNSHTADSLVLGLAGTLEVPIRLSRQSRLIPRFTVGYEYDAMGDANQEHQLTASFAQVKEPGSLDVLGQNRGANALDVALSLELEASETFSLYVDVGGSFWSNGNELNYGGGIRWRFGGAPAAKARS